MNEKLLKGTIDEWEIINRTFDGEQFQVVIGKFGTKYIRTSPIVNIEGNVVITENSVYILGTVANTTK